MDKYNYDENNGLWYAVFGTRLSWGVCRHKDATD